MKNIPTTVFITVDTEHSIGGAFRNPELKPVGNDKRIFGKIGNKYFGIPLIMDIADEFDLPVVFFLEVLNRHYFGKDESRAVCEYILNRGHDVQLHIHPNYLNFIEPYPERLKYKDNMSSYKIERQSQLIHEGKTLLMEYGVKYPLAFRAGNFGANQNTLKALAENEFQFDSSYNLAFPTTMKDVKQHKIINDMEFIGGVVELPITCFQEHIPFIGKRVRPLDINGVGFGEMKETLEHANEHNYRCVTIILHSFSFYKTKDPQYQLVYVMKNVIRRFKKLCRYLKQNKDRFEVVRFTSLSGMNTTASEEGHHDIPKISFKNSIVRYAEQAISLL